MIFEGITKTYNIMKKKKALLKLKKQKISSLDGKQVNGGIIIVTTTTIQFITQQANCRTLFCPTDTCPTMPSSCCSHTQTTTLPFTLAC